MTHIYRTNVEPFILFQKQISYIEIITVHDQVTSQVDVAVKSIKEADYQKKLKLK